MKPVPVGCSQRHHTSLGPTLHTGCCQVKYSRGTSAPPEFDIEPEVQIKQEPAAAATRSRLYPELLVTVTAPPPPSLSFGLATPSTPPRRWRYTSSWQPTTWTCEPAPEHKFILGAM